MIQKIVNFHDQTLNICSFNFNLRHKKADPNRVGQYPKVVGELCCFGFWGK